MFGGYIDLADTWFVQKALSGGGVIMDNGPHAIDLIRFLFGEIQSVVAHAARHQAIEVEDTAQLTFHMKNGVIGTADLTWSNSIPAQNYMEVYGENGTILLDFEGLSYKFKNWSEWKREPNGVDVRTAFARQINHFVEAMLGNGPSRLNGEDGQRSQAAIEGAYQSLDLGRKVEL
jgi:predicted dehydrogenase